MIKTPAGVGAGQIGLAIARRVGVGKHVVLADRSEKNANAAAEVMANAGYQVSVVTVDVSSRETVHALVGQATGSFITGSDFLMDAGVTGAYWYGDVAEVRTQETKD